MAESDVDIASLTEAQQLALQQYTAVTDQDLSAAVPLLQRCEWNVQVLLYLEGSFELFRLTQFLITR